MLFFSDILPDEDLRLSFYPRIYADFNGYCIDSFFSQFSNLTDKFTLDDYLFSFTFLC